MKIWAPLLLSLSGRAYRSVVSRYPIALRARYEDEMQEVFRDQIRDAWLENGFAGFARVWLEVARETSTFMLPRCLRVSGIGLIAVVSSLSLFYIFSLDALPFYSPVSCSAETHKPPRLSSTPWARWQQKLNPKSKRNPTSRIPGFRSWHASEQS